MITCNKCQRYWTALGAAHCGACCRTFSSVSLFDRHRYVTQDIGGCLKPEEMMSHGARVAFFRDGMWRGPAFTEAERDRVFGSGALEEGDGVPT